MKTETYQIKKGQKCTIDAEVYGMTIEGPATLIVLTQAAKEATACDVDGQ
ncbi:hypothetical protein NLX78_22930 [Paenibacillus sp. Lou8.1]|nr:hypothetical protein [Paenibacillus sp. Lou8.1]MCP3810079.1 hypothetical protein [Paenibacillus sp. Lou8.1]